MPFGHRFVRGNVMPRYYFHLSAPDESFRDPIGFELSDLSAAQKGDAMITSDELMSHAARCTRLAEASKDKAVAEKFRQLARDYCDLATTRGTPDHYQCINDSADYRRK